MATPALVRCAIALLAFAASSAIAVAVHALSGGRDAGALGLAFTALTWVLTTLIAFSFFLALAGLWLTLRPGRRSPTPPTDRRPRTAILMPVYNESVRDVFARIEAMRQSLAATERAPQFEFYVLSDSTNPDTCLAEQVAWSVAQASRLPSPVYYRRRSNNRGKKAGNLQEFCERWGALYDYLVVLDADSLMGGRTLVEMVDRMEADPRLGLLQSCPVPINQHSLWARCQQFAAAVYGPIFSRGYAAWAGDAGNYWGHNAIIRSDAFRRHCGLSELPGRRPLGGEIISHDFVEAALLRRAGYKVRLDADLTDSFEECPPTLPDHAARDRRWCQGNLQHARLVLSANIRPLSRAHFLLGVLAYASSPLWLATILLGLALPQAPQAGRADGWLLVFGVILAMLLAPRLFAVVASLVDRQATRGVGVLSLTSGVLIETLVSVLTAPIMMLLHTYFVLATLGGFVVGWSPQTREGHGLRWGQALAAHWWQSLAGLVLLSVVAWLRPALLPWLSPVLLGMIAAPALSVLVSSERIGNLLARARLLITGYDLNPPLVLQRQKALVAQFDHAHHADALTRLLDEPLLAALHDVAGRSSPSAGEADANERRRRLRQLIDEPAMLPPESRLAALRDRAGMRLAARERVAMRAARDALSALKSGAAPPRTDSPPPPGSGR